MYHREWPLINTRHYIHELANWADYNMYLYIFDVFNVKGGLPRILPSEHHFEVKGPLVMIP